MPYLDNNATTKPLPAVVNAVRCALEDNWHNPSSVHRQGQAASHVLELARADLAALVGLPPRQLTFTSSGTESIDLAIRGVLGASQTNTLITSRLEHSAVRDLAQHLEKTGKAKVRWLKINPGGLIDLDDLERALNQEPPALVSIQWANNETGVIQPIQTIHEICQAAGALLHTDAVQWIGKMPVNHSPPADLITFSPHKFHGPKGIGILTVRPGVRLRPTLQGSQELGRRGGTQNLPGALGAAAAATAAKHWLTDESSRAAQSDLRNRFEAAILKEFPNAVVNAADQPRLWNTSNIGFPRLEAEAILLSLSERGLAASAGAACSSGSLDPSPVLLAVGIPPKTAHGSVRFSLSRFTTKDDIDQAVQIVHKSIKRLSASMHA